MARGGLHWDKEKLRAALNESPRLRAKLEEYAKKAIDIAKGVYAAESKGEGRLPILYEESFDVEHHDHNGLPAVSFVNTDPEAVYVEFGLNAGNGDSIYRYRVFGKTIDILEAGGLK